MEQYQATYVQLASQKKGRKEQKMFTKQTKILLNMGENHQCRCIKRKETQIEGT